MRRNNKIPRQSYTDDSGYDSSHELLPIDRANAYAEIGKDAMRFTFFERRQLLNHYHSEDLDALLPRYLSNEMPISALVNLLDMKTPAPYTKTYTPLDYLKEMLQLKLWENKPFSAENVSANSELTWEALDKYLLEFADEKMQQLPINEEFIALITAIRQPLVSDNTRVSALEAFTKKWNLPDCTPENQETPRLR